MKPINCKKLIILAGFVGAGLLASAFIFSVTLAFDESSPDFAAAMKDLSSATGQQVTTKDQAIALCDSEKYFTSCAEVGKKYHLYSSEEVKQVDVFVSELKGKIQEELQSCQTTECLIGVANKLSQKVSAKNPKLAEQAELTSKFVQKKQAIIEAAKELGVDFEKCREIDPDTASIETLRACAKLAKDSRVRGNLPKEALEHAQMADKSIELQDALKSGQVQCGNGTLESCGNFCLKPSAETKAQGAAAIPPICREIAQKFFGPEGVKHLESAYSQVQAVHDNNLKRAQNLTFTTIDGRNLTSLDDIGQYMEGQGKAGNVEAVEKGMDFMVSNGFIKPEEKEYALKFVKQIKEKGGQINFDQCAQDPQSCRDFIPQENQAEFEVHSQIKDIITKETGFDPSQCGSSDPSVGEKCFQGAKKALTKLESLNNQSPEVQKIIQDLRSKVNHQQEFHNQQSQVQQTLQQRGGPGGCKSEEECRGYCSDPAHGPECISFGAKQGISGFKGSEAVERFQNFNQTLQAPQQNQSQFPGQGQGVQNGFPGQGFGVQGGFPGQGFGQQTGPSPECLAAIQSGDFVKAKTVCEVHLPIFTTPYPVPTLSSSARPVCPSLPTVDSCPSGQVKYVTYSSPDCGVYYGCKDEGGYPSYSPGPSGSYSPGPYPTYSTYPIGSYPPPSCPSGSYWDSYTHVCKPSSGSYSPPPPGVSYTPYPTYSSGPGTGACSASLTNLLGTGCHWMYNDSSGRGIFCDGPMTKSAKEGDTATTAGCTGSNGYSPAPSGSYTPYPSPSSTPVGSGTCPSGSHSMGGYCMSDTDSAKCGAYGSTSVSSFVSCSTFGGGTTTSYTPQPSPGTCPSGQWWDYSTSSCKTSSSTYTPSPSSGVSYTPAPTSSGYCGDHICSASESYTTCPVDCGGGSTYTPYPTYSNSPTYSPSTTYTPYPSSSTAPTYSYTPYPTYSSAPTPYPTYSTAPSESTFSCPSGQYFDSTTHTCKSTTSFDYRAHQLAVTITACHDSGGSWDKVKLDCRSSLTNYFFGSIFRLFVPGFGR